MFTEPSIFCRARVAGFRVAWLVGILLLSSFSFPEYSVGRIYIDINAPSIRKFKIAIPDFKSLNPKDGDSELSVKLAGVISNDLDLSGYFTPIDKAAFLEEENDASLAQEKICFKDWSVIGAELLLTGAYTCIGRSVEVEIRLFDVFRGRQILGKRALGDMQHYRYVMHRLSNEIIRTLTGHEGPFLTKLAFVGNATGHKEIYVSDYDGHNVHQLTSDKTISLLPRFSPDGKQIVYNSYKEDAPMLYLQDLSSDTVRRISGRSGLNIGAAWRPGGAELALTLSLKGNPDIYMIDLRGKILKHLISHWAIDVSPSFSPDGSRIAFVSNRSGSPQIYVLNLKDGTEKRLTFEGKYNTSPAWSSLDRIAFTSMDNGHFEVYTIDSDGGSLRKLTDNSGDNEDPCWSPDGRHIIFSSNREGRYHLYIMNVNGQNQRKITSLKGDQSAPSWGLL
ncbi:MAG: Tol-Pal system beta propeller repeat protein TolB [Thermodesulfobacteriota bacterium]|nr:Tol-Pal system beta propeller repeat protein TolB [Thermodesulfobacteriota bacterium]